ncbi:hypothetical protein GCM10027568_21030 [Humibacter soli]
MAGHSELAPLPGDPSALKAKADGLSSAAEQIQQAIDHLRQLADRDQTVSLAVDSVRGNASDVADNITKAQIRYAGTARALQDYAPKLESGQQRALRAISAYNSAQQQVSSAQTSLQQQQEQYNHDQSSAPAPAPGAEAPKTFGETPAGNRASQAVTDANGAVSDAMSEYNGAIAEIDAAAQVAISQIKKAISDSGLNDGFWDKLGHALESAWNDAVAWAKKYLAPVLDVIQKVAAAIADIGGYISMVLNILAVFIPVLAPIAAAVDIIVLAAAAVSFIATAALVVLGDRTLGDLLNTGITLVMSALPIKADAAALKGVKGLGGFSKVADKLAAHEGALGKTFGLVEKAGNGLNKYSGLEKLTDYVGTKGKALGEAYGKGFGGVAGDVKGSVAGVKEFMSSRAGGDGIFKSLGNAGQQFRTTAAETLQHWTEHGAEQGEAAAVGAVRGVVSVSAGNNLAGGVDYATQNWLAPHASFFNHFQEHSALSITPVTPNLSLVGSHGFDMAASSTGSPATLVHGLGDLVTKAPVAAYHASFQAGSVDLSKH